MATYTQRLIGVQAAIDALLTTGQSVRFENRTITFAQLAELQKLETQYQSLAAMEKRAARGGGRAGITYVTPL